MDRLKGKSVLITGAAAGIGRASAVLFAAEGARVGVVDIEPTAGQRVVKEIEAAGGQAVFVHADVTDTRALEGAVNAVAGAFGGLDVLYNNAGGATSHDGSLVDMPLEEFQHAIGLNLFGPFAAIRFAIPWMVDRGAGSIINTASIRAMIGTLGADGYTAAKGGIVTMTRALALQLGPHRIRVNAIAPGAVMTERVRAFMESGNDSGPDETLVKRHILGLGEPEDVASVALFFASDDSRWVTGQILPVDGGASAN
jgi:NAD(P)-dependent dehydrogenase (short-subunit alcohol dehydrogenase family)